MFVHVILSSKNGFSMVENGSDSESRAFMMLHRFSFDRGQVSCLIGALIAETRKVLLAPLLNFL